MEEVKIKIDSKGSSDTSEDIVRYEEEWTSENQHFLKNIMNDCLDLSNRHNLASHYNKKKYICFSIPTIIIPLVVANISIFLTIDYATPICLTSVSILNGISVLLNFSKNSELYSQYGGLYSDLAAEISTILVRGKKFRPPFDVTLQKITGKKRHIDGNAPPL